MELDQTLTEKINSEDIDKLNDSFIKFRMEMPKHKAKNHHNGSSPRSVGFLREVQDILGQNNVDSHIENKSGHPFATIHVRPDEFKHIYESIKDRADINIPGSHIKVFLHGVELTGIELAQISNEDSSMMMTSMIASLDRGLEQIIGERKEYRQQRDRFRSENDELQEQYNELESEKKDLERQYTQLQKSEQSLSGALLTSKDRISALEDSLARCEGITPADADHNSEEIERLGSRVDELEESLNSAHRSRKELESQLQNRDDTNDVLAGIIDVASLYSGINRDITINDVLDKSAKEIYSEFIRPNIDDELTYKALKSRLDRMNILLKKLEPVSLRGKNDALGDLIELTHQTVTPLYIRPETIEKYKEQILALESGPDVIKQYKTDRDNGVTKKSIMENLEQHNTSLKSKEIKSLYTDLRDYNEALLKIMLNPKFGDFDSFNNRISEYESIMEVYDKHVSIKEQADGLERLIK